MSFSPKPRMVLTLGGPQEKRSNIYSLRLFLLGRSGRPMADLLQSVLLGGKVCLELLKLPFGLFDIRDMFSF